MAVIQAYCGLDCGECEAYIATRNDDQDGLRRVAEKWAKEYKAENLAANKCICDGCPSGKRLSAAHAAGCGVRRCASSRGVRTCAHCEDYACDTLQNFFAFAPILKDKLEEIRVQLGK